MTAFRESFPAGAIGDYLLEGSERVPFFSAFSDSKQNAKRGLGDSSGMPGSNFASNNPSSSSSAARGRPMFEDVTKSALSPSARAAYGFSVQVDVIEVDVSELKRMHMFQANSPFLIAACGRWEERTKVCNLYTVLDYQPN